MILVIAATMLELAQPATAMVAVAEPQSVLAEATKASGFCAVWSTNTEADRARYMSVQEWKTVAGGRSFSHRSVPVTYQITNERNVRNCEVNATLTSDADQSELITTMEAIVGQKPQESGDSLNWLFKSKTQQIRLQLFPDRKSEQPKVRFLATVS